MGGVYCVANLRGGGEYGKKWHEAGMLKRKQNVFDDFIAAAEALVKNDYTRPEKIAIMGGSNGGLLVGAVLNQRPDLFGAAIPAVGRDGHAALPPVHGGAVLGERVWLGGGSGHVFRRSTRTRRTTT